MKRRNADTGKMRRPVKRTKIVEGMYGNSMVYLKFVMIWATVVMADYMLEFRFEFLWPFWLMLRSVCDSFRYQGVIFSVFFICIALTSDMICFFFIPLQYLIFAASTYVWVQFMWYTFAERGVCVPTAALAAAVLYAEGAVRARAAPELWRPLAAHCLGFPALSLGFGLKAYVGQRLRQRRQRQVRAENEFYFQLLRDALPESALEQKTEDSKGTSNGECTQGTQTPAQAHTHTQAHAHTQAHTHSHMNGSVRRRCARDHNGVCVAEHALHVKLDKLEKHLQRDKPHTPASASASTNTPTNTNTHTPTSTSTSTQAASQTHSNGAASGSGAPLDDHEHSKGSKASKCEKKETTTVNERKKHKNRDKDISDSLKNTEITKEILVKEKEVESTKENVKSNKEVSSHKEKEKDKEREKEKEKEKERKEDKEKESREKEREQKDKEQRARSLSLELRRVRAELSAARAGEAEARRALAHAQDGSKESRRLERRLSEERRARTAAEHQLLRARHAARTPSGECDSEWCRSRRASCEAEAAALRRELQRAREQQGQLQRDLAGAKEQVRTLEAWEAREALERSRAEEAQAAAAALRERAGHLERALSAETRVKLDLLSALGDAKRHMRIQESLISRQEKEIEELKAQMLAVMPTEFVTPVTGSVSKLRLSDGSPLDPNATVYTPKQLCSDA